MPPVPSPGRLLAGRYTVLDLLGQGGMGVVLAAYDARLDRRVALKLLRSREKRDGREAEARLVREAQTMARLSSPHVVAVYDAGTLEGGSVFIAMEYVEGQTLRHWCQQQPRSWREVLDKYVAAGRGLAAAHAAGIIHRDFKPDNVLVGKDERVRVTDFGLARAEQVSPGATQPPEHPASPGAALPARSISTLLTVPGTIMGTPVYMAPEVLQGKPADVRSDVYAFSVALYEALYGQLPYEGNSLAELLQSQSEGKVRPVPASTEVPGWVRTAVIQGLEADPTRRPAELEQLLRALEPAIEEKRRARAQVVTWVVGLGLLVSAAAVVWRHQQGPGCTQEASRLSGVWDEAVKARAKQSLESTGVPYAPDTFLRFAGVLDAYTGEWVRQRTEVCEALREQEPQPQSLPVRREYCLERRRSKLRALTELFGQGPDKALVSKAVKMAKALPPLEDCVDVQELMASVPPPDVRARLEALQHQVDRLEALLGAGKYTEGLAHSEELLSQVESTGHAPMQAQVLYFVARHQEGAGDYKGAEARMRQALTLAARGKDLSLLARAWNQLAVLVGYRQQRLQEAEHLWPAVETAVELGEDAPTHVSWLNNQGILLAAAARPEEAKESFERAVLLAEKALGPEQPHTAASLNNLGDTLLDMGRYEEAREKYERALLLFENLLGPEHPEAAIPLLNLGNALGYLGSHEEARKKYERALTLFEKALGPEHPYVAEPLEGLGRMSTELGNYTEARAWYERALILREKTLGSQHPELARTLIGLSTLHLAQGQPAEAVPLLERALKLATDRSRPDVQFELGRALWSVPRERSRAVRLATQAREHWQRIGHQPRLAQVSQWLAAHPSP